MSNEAYQLYMQRFSYREIGEELNIGKEKARYWIKKYARENGLPYPRPKLNCELPYNLYLNGMSLRDIGLYLGIKDNSVWYRIDKYCKQNFLEKPMSNSNRAKVAYDLRKKYNYTYSKIAKMVGYSDKSNCRRAILKYKENLC